ncbi:HEAT repeat domain-containing protein [Oceanispirochaeta sp.]|jgi:HEAT repeat protein|uniref:HEAT repeat domain-containing protein n=1 Tax=Oceanispirochaeta sp. TaxID=2035350 RepID=UPI0026383779|nr:HEAT repeat domain-containing protein [Oceanispirochaeta sp.]MDA3956652.1 HEAT repeat domain-containing protein [Oceanispirochaeta sp.]
MVREDEKINRRNLGKHIIISATVLLLFVSSCSVLDPLRLTYENDRQIIIDEILKRGRLYTIRKNDESALISLLEESDPQIRLAAIKLMEHNASPQIYDALVLAVLDDDEILSAEAQRVLLEDWEDSYKAVIRGLNSSQSSVVYASIDLIRKKESREDSIYLLTLFGDERSTVRANASRVFVALNEYENPWYQSLLESPEPLIRQTAVETLPRFNNPDIVPSLIQYMLDPIPEVRRAAIFGISEFDKEALPALHETVKITGIREMRLSILELIDGILEPESIPVLVSLLSDKDSLVAAKSEEILFRQGPDSIPELLKQMPLMEEPALLLSFDLLRRYKDKSCLPSLSGYFDHKSLVVRQTAIDTVMSFGSAAFPFLIDTLDHGNQEIQNQALILLVDQRAASLVYDSEKNDYPVNLIFYFFESMTEKEILMYLNRVSLPNRVVSALLNLYEIELNTRQYQEIRGMRDPESNRYLYFYREWEDALINAELSRQGSFSYMHQYFDTGEDAWLTESKQLRDAASQFDHSSLSFRESAFRFGAMADSNEISMVSRYIYSRKQLAESWRVLSSDIQNLAMLVFLRYSLDIQAVLRDYDYFRTLSSKSSPIPENL